MNSKLFKLCLSAILALSFNACGGDSNDDDNGGGGNDKVKCTAGDVICNPAGTGLLVCNAAGNGYDNGDSCDLGCENNACKKDNGGSTTTVCEANKKECKNNQILTCKADGSGYLNDVDDCPYGCENGASECLTQKCTQGQTKCSSDGSSVETCNASGSWDSSACPIGCDGGHCVEVPSYDACSAADLEDCLSRIEAAGYDRTDGVCLMEDGEAGCYLGKCNVPNTSKIECNEKYGAMMVSVCSPIGNDGSGVWELMDIADDGECEFGCKEDLSACAEPLVPDQGKECNPDTYADQCSDSGILSWCYEDEDEDGNAIYYVRAINCPKNNRVCDIVTISADGETINYGDCFSEADKCNAPNSEVVSCKEDYYAVKTVSYCGASTKNPSVSYAVPIDQDYCPSNACKEDGSDCTDPLVPDQGTECTPSTRAAQCTAVGGSAGNEVYSACVDPYAGTFLEGLVYEVEAMNCADVGFDGCFETLDGDKLCAKTCTDSSEKSYTCDESYVESDGVAILVEYSCQDGANSSKILVESSEKLCSSCDESGACNISDADKGGSLEEGDECNYYLYESKCVSNKVWSCEETEDDDNVVTVSACKTGESCVVFSDYNYATCKGSDAKTCASDKAGTRSYVCVSQEDGGETYWFSVEYICVAGSNGTNYDLMKDHELCSSTCNASTGLCD